MNVGQAGVPLVFIALTWLLAFAGLVVAARLPSRSHRTAVLVRGGVVVCALAGLGLSLYALLGDPRSGGPAGDPRAATDESIATGAELFRVNCAACHGTDAMGDGHLAETTEVPPPPLVGVGDVHSEAQIFEVITNGLPGGMPAWGDVLSETDRWDLVNYLRTLEATDEPEHEH